MSAPLCAPIGAPRPTLALVGPTASGKTAAALALAAALEARGGAEIISVDSALVYRGMDIGTAKPSREELAQTPHHLIDILDPLQSYSAAEFARDAGRLIDEIRARGKTPLLVGGTMLYLKALREGLSEMPPADPVVRAELQQQALAQGWPALHARLATVDPQTAHRLAPHDSQRIGRALEVWALTGRPLSAFHQNAPIVQPGRDIVVLSLEPENRGWLHERIAHRFDAMLAAGFLDEVRRLRARADLHPELPSMRCVGYRQAWQGLQEGWSDSEIRERGIFATRQLAKRQLTWLRSLPERRVVAADAHGALAQVLSSGLSVLQI
jgi:tRNA dimethylallyltransferase